ncbi:4Fe-4S dicluster domain-containing protein [Thermincola potens]|uniref:Respiratory-chain NADH dehydrogenase domain 51 kDa subunit n=1 Tax=Thermincola potens (strain JR) TaxID=635013 RepID=D5XBV6_THEPJ|nr:4Fe-4S dicluster domain-containing protein [Thermincola potens]ADG81504.1 Respiratory-chain NADH dehydrogenase domain 51 kDa subunit [Thermincola potens JR]
MSKEAIAAIQKAGVVGAGGAGFPAYKKLDAKVDVVVVNGAECEPLLRVDQQLMEKEARFLTDSLLKVLEITGASKGIFALKAKYTAAVEALEKAIKGSGKIELKLLGDFYPAGDEQVLLYEATGRIVPEGGIPVHVGAVVTNVETLLNVGHALAGKPVTEKYVTVTGAVEKPLTVKVPVGISVRELVETANPVPEKYKVIEGGPMMGTVLENPDKPVTKITKGLIVLPENHSLLARKEITMAHTLNRARSVCCQCNKCTEICPRYLLGHRMKPHRVMRAVGQGIGGLAGDLAMAFLCCQCGACEIYGCDMGLAPNRINAELKKQLQAAGLKNPYSNATLQANADREMKKIPVKRLIIRLNLESYNLPAPLSPKSFSTNRVTLPLSQHIGAPAKPVVRPGDSVKCGDLIAEAPEGALSVPLHASINGRVAMVSEKEIVIEN